MVDAFATVKPAVAVALIFSAAEIVSPVAVPGFAMEIPITPPVLVSVPSAVTVPPPNSPAAKPRPEITRIPSTPELVIPAVLTLP